MPKLELESTDMFFERLCDTSLSAETGKAVFGTPKNGCEMMGCIAVPSPAGSGKRLSVAAGRGRPSA